MRVNRKAGRVARTLYRLCVVDGAVDGTRARRVSRRLASSGRRGALPILAAFHRFVSLDHDRHTAHVESAMPLDASVRDEIRADLLRVYGPGVQTSFAENAALIGGVRIKVGSDVYDGSLRSRLAALEARL
jgi:F-type H+-transporting ATPase subunit delta